MTKKAFIRLLPALLLCCFAVLFTTCDGAFGSDDNPMSQIEQKFSTTPLTMEALSAGTIVVDNPVVGMMYTKNDDAKTAVTDEAIQVAKGDKIAFYGKGTSTAGYYDSKTNYTKISGGTADVKVYGNIMSLVDEKGFAKAKTLTEENAFRRLFLNNTHITDASGLLLPATKLTYGCYECMFYNCSNLTVAPELPATKLVDECYTLMFGECVNLGSITCLATDISAEGCTKDWLLNTGYEVTGEKTFNKAASMTEWGPDESGTNGWTVKDK